MHFILLQEALKYIMICSRKTILGYIMLAIFIATWTTSSVAVQALQRAVPDFQLSALRHCTKYADIRRRIYQRRVKKQHLRIYYSHLYHTVFPCNHLISTAGLSFLPHITSIPLLFGFVFVQPPLNPPLF